MPSTGLPCLPLISQFLKNRGLRPACLLRHVRPAERPGIRIRFFAVLALPLLLIAGCRAPYTQPVQTNAIAVTVIGLWGTGGGLVLQDNGSDNLPVSANGSFTFSQGIATGANYKVTVMTQPSSPTQNCTVTNDSGTATASGTNVKVDCGHFQWTWVGGSKLLNQNGTYGTLGVAAASNTPGARTSAASWVDGNGNFWIFGGFGFDAAGGMDMLNDLWEYSAGQWKWVAGSNFISQKGTYGTQGVAAASNVPGARLNAFSWVDAAGNLWLFGGIGLDSTSTRNVLNDLWKFSAGNWIWMGGSAIAGQTGSYGTLGTASASNIPGARQGNATWVDNHGDFWLFGGLGYDAAGTHGDLNDLWKYSSGQWTWMSGSNLAAQLGNYGTQGVAASTNVPGSRQNPTTWTDASGNLWLFGGIGASNLLGVFLNDLWKYSGGQWTWMGGTNSQSQSGVYGTQGTPSAGNVPGGRFSSVGWKDASGDLYLFGGWGLDSTGTQGYLNDLWGYSNGQWTWIGGSNLGNQTGAYGALGVIAPGNVPGGRLALNGWVDTNQNILIFGGTNNVGGNCGCFNDVWKLLP